MPAAAYFWEHMVHSYRSNGYNIVLDVNSGSIHVVDDAVYALIPEVEGIADRGRDDIMAALCAEPRLLDTYGEDVLREAVTEILTLKERGELFTEDEYETVIDEALERKPVVKALCLNIAHDCNLRCRYCFADEGTYHGDRKGLMSLDVAKAALDFLVRESGERRNLEVDFFGGEPLMNWEVVKETVRYGRSLEKEHDKNFRFTLTTNGTLLTDEVLEFANREMGNLVLSIDGRKEVNDRMRPRKGGQGTYDDIVPWFKKAAASRHNVRYYVRGTYTHHNLDFAEDVKHLADLGFTQISVEPVVARPEDDYALTESDVPVLCEQYDELARFYLQRRKEGKPFNFFHFNIDLEGGPCVVKRLSGCGSGCEYLGVTPWGELYPCHQFVGNTSFIMGDVYKGITRPDIRERFRKSSVYTRPHCSKCFARYYCSGGCAANAYNFGGDIDASYDIGCELQRKRVECAIMIKVAIAMESEEI